MGKKKLRSAKNPRVQMRKRKVSQIGNIRHTVTLRSRIRGPQGAIRTMASRPDLFGNLNSTPRPTANSQLLDAIAPEPAAAVAPAAMPSSLAPSGTASPSPARKRGIDMLGQLESQMQQSRQRRGGSSTGPLDTLTRAELARKSRDIERMQYRPWRAGDVYAPHDLSAEEMKRYRMSKPPRADVFDVLQINPLDEYKNIPLMLDFVTALGRLKHQKETGLRPVNQRKIARAVKRATAVGLLPRTHAHPEMLRRPGPWFRKP